MIYASFLAIALAATAALNTSAPCFDVVSTVVNEHPKPAYPKDPRQYTLVKKEVETMVCDGSCQAASGASCLTTEKTFTYEHPKASYANDPRRNLWVKVPVERTMCGDTAMTQGTAACCVSGSGCGPKG